MSALAYKKLALEWQPAQQKDRSFQRLAAAILFVVLVLAIILSMIPVPEQERRQRAPVPDRIAKFISEKPKPPPPPERPEPKPKPPPKVEPKPVVKREQPREEDRAPLTEAQKTAREKAEASGLLALRSEMSDLMDTTEVSSMVSGGLSEDSADTNRVAGHDIGDVTAGAAQGGGGLGSDRYGSRVGNTTLTNREIADVNSDLFVGRDSDEDIASTADGETRRSGNGRSREDVTIVFDRNKGGLYALYARERRKSPGLQGTIVLEITINPQGDVTHVEVVSSELDSPSLERGIVARIKAFKFEANDVDEVTVTYPIEFLPS